MDETLIKADGLESRREYTHMDIENLQKHFDEFWYQKPASIKIRNESRTLKNFQERLSGYACTEEIDDYIFGTRSRKETLRRIAVAFYDFLRREKGMAVESDLENTRFYDYPFERQFEIAKFLHEPHTNREIMEELNIGSERTLREDLEALRDGIEVMGTTVQITEEKRGRTRYYRSTLHPVFLPLNLTEVYALTVYMPRVMKDGSANAQIIQWIGDRVKAQLSDHALKRLFPDERGYRTEPEHLRYNDDEELAKSRKGILMYLMKSGESCSFFLEGKKLKGRIRYENGAYRLVCDDGTELDIDPEAVEFIIEDLDYR